MPTTEAYPSSRGAEGISILSTHENSVSVGSDKRQTQIVFFAQGNASAVYPDTKKRIASQFDVTELGGYGSPAHLMADVFFPIFGGGVDVPVFWYPLDLTGEAAAAGSITPSISGGAITKPQSFRIKVNNRPCDKFSTDTSDTVATIVGKMTAAISAKLDIPVAASDGVTECGIVAKWEGESGNNLHIEIEMPVGSEVSFAIVQPTGGTGTPDITAALLQVGEAWDTHFVNQLDYTDGDELDEFSAFGEARRTGEIHKPVAVFTGTNEASRATITAITDARKSDRTNYIIPNPGSKDLPFIVAAEAVKAIAMRESRDPSYDYVGLPMPGLTPGADVDAWNSTVRQAAYEAGCSTTKVVDGQVQISDVISCYHPTGEVEPGFRYLVDFAKRSTVIHNIDILFAGIQGRPVVKNSDTPRNPNALKPVVIEGMLAGMTDNLASELTVITDPDYSKEHTGVTIGTANSKRLDVLYIAKLSGNANVISIDYKSSFNYGG